MKKIRLQKLSIMLLIIVACSTNLVVAQDKTKATNVEVLKLSPQKLMVFKSYVGYLKPFDRGIIKTEIDGTIEKINFEEGKVVKKNQVLVHVSTNQLELQEQIVNSNFNQASSEYETQKLFFVKTSSSIGHLSADTEIPETEIIDEVDLASKTNSNQFSIKQLEIQVKVNESNYRQALSEYKKQKTLFDKKISNITVMEKFENLMEVSELNLELSKLTLQKAKISDQAALDAKRQQFKRAKKLREKRNRIQGDTTEHISTRRLGMQVRLAETDYEHALGDYQTQQILFDNDLINANVLEKYHNTLELIKIKLQLAKLEYAQSQIQDNTRLETYRNAMQNAKLKLKLAQLDLEKSKIPLFASQNVLYRAYHKQA